MPGDFFSLTQIVGYIAFGVVIAAFWQKNDRRLLLLNGAAACFWTIQYAMLGTWTGVATEILVMLRSFISAFLTDRKQKNLAAGIFIVGFIAAGILTSQYPYDWIAVVSCITATISMIYLRQFHLRYGMLLATLLWAIFNFYAGTIGGVLAGIVLASVKIMTICRMFRDKQMAEIPVA